MDTYVLEGDRWTSVRVSVIFVSIDKNHSFEFTQMLYITNHPYTTIHHVKTPNSMATILLQPKRFFIDQSCSLDVFPRKEWIIRSCIKRYLNCQRRWLEPIILSKLITPFDDLSIRVFHVLTQETLKHCISSATQQHPDNL